MARASLPPLTGLRAFESFARLGSMTAAAAELRVTHGAVSRQVRGLELQLGASLVTGPRHRLELTEAGRKLAQAVSSGFEMIAGGLPGAGAETAQELVVSCLGTLAMKWLIPRLPDFLESHPGVRVRILESHLPADFSDGAAHAAIRIHARSRIEGMKVEAFMDHWHGPVVAPSLLAEVDGDLSRVLALPRLHSETFREAWGEWAVRAGLALPASSLDREFEHNSYMLEAAAAGLGVAVTAWGFAADDIARGRLVAPFGFEAVDARYVYLRPRHGQNTQAEAFGAWLKVQGRKSPRPPPAVRL